MRRLLQVILDTSVIVAAIRSKRGAAYRLLLQLAAVDARWQINLSTAFVLEYEAKAREHGAKFGYTDEQIDNFLDFICSIANEVPVHFRWRPLLRDADDEFVLELAIAAGADYIVTFNVRNFVGAETFGIKVACAARIFTSFRRNKMSEIQTQIPDAIYKQIIAFAEREKLSLEQVVSLALAHSLGTWTAESLIAERAKHGSRKKFLEFMSQVPDIKPDEHDRLS